MKSIRYGASGRPFLSSTIYCRLTSACSGSLMKPLRGDQPRNAGDRRLGGAAFPRLRYFEKPIAGYWINSIGQWLFGHNNFAVRFGWCFPLPSPLCWSPGWHGVFFRDKRVAILSPAIFLTALLVLSAPTRCSTR